MPSNGAEPEGNTHGLAGRLEARLRPAALETLRRIGREGDARGVPTYLVGGFVRDLLLDRENADLDLVTEGDAIELARRLGPPLGAAAKAHPRFGTASLRFPDGSHIDLATARTERYARPAALPDVEPASIDDDLLRRDFTINAMAIRLDAAQFGELYDPHHGEVDLRGGEIRAMHPLSFVEDPTRLMRAIRFEARFGFRLEPSTRLLARAAIDEGRLATLTPERFRREVMLGLEEPEPIAVIRGWETWGVLDHLTPGLRAPEALLDRILDAACWFAGLRQREAPDRSLVLLAALVSPLGPDRAAAVCRDRLRLSAPKAVRLDACLSRAPALVEAIPGLDPAALTRRLGPESLESLVYAAALDPRIRGALGGYVQIHRHVKLGVSGDELIARGCRPGPRFGEAMQAALDEKLRGGLETREETIEYLLRRLSDSPEAGQASDAEPAPSDRD